MSPRIGPPDPTTVSDDLAELLALVTEPDGEGLGAVAVRGSGLPSR